MTTTGGEFVELVARMRAAQRDYSRLRCQESLVISMRLEREVDLYIKRLDGPRTDTPLFDRMEAPT